ncbi:hypothetical protein BS78_K134900 [Paspalum vaginatum]|uniref:CCHC-type domain-containing protein n=1 Tax=Paspalum vaginatum TaxID=158149 RepID=A0A9W7X9M9_9POAL|nr:hypothetical protein BS78_K134900 [Paspalum vaginatum]
MASSAPPAPRLPPLPGAPTFHSPMPASATDPAATSLAVLPVRPAHPSSLVRGASPSLSPFPSCGGRSKAQRWSDDDDCPSADATRQASNKEVLLATKAPASATVEVVADGSGWVMVEDRRARRKCLRTLKPPPRAIPADLRGLCFNCFSPSHRAAECQRHVRCFHCRSPRHRTRVCPRRQMAAPHTRRVLEWRPIAHAALMPAPGLAATVGPYVDASAVGAGDVGGGRRRTRRGQRKHGVGHGNGSPPPDASKGEELVLPERAAAHLPVVAVRPRRVHRRSASIAHAEDELQRALIVLVVGQEATGCASEVSGVLALRFHLEADALDLRRAAPIAFICFLLDEELAGRVYNEGRPFIADNLCLHIRRWSRQALAAGGGALPFFVDIVLRGVPAHALKVEMAELLLNDYCLVQGLHPDTEERHDLQTFKLQAWCAQLELIPECMHLHIVEPLIVDGMEPAEIRTLVYPIAILVSVVARPPVQHPPSPPAPTNFDDDRGHDQYKRRRRLPPSSSTSLGAGCLRAVGGGARDVQ